MTRVEKKFRNIEGEIVGRVIARIQFSADRKELRLSLAGTITGRHAQELYEFIRDVACFPATEWRLQLAGVKTLSLKAVRALTKLARRLERRGIKLAISSHNPIVLSLLRELRVLKHFAIEKPASTDFSRSRRYSFEINPGEPVS